LAPSNRFDSSPAFHPVAGAHPVPAVIPLGVEDSVMNVSAVGRKQGDTEYGNVFMSAT
jgi:hypothetical protein